MQTKSDNTKLDRFLLSAPCLRARIAIRLTAAHDSTDLDFLRVNEMRLQELERNEDIPDKFTKGDQP